MNIFCYSEVIAKLKSSALTHLFKWRQLHFFMNLVYSFWLGGIFKSVVKVLHARMLEFEHLSIVNYTEMIESFTVL